jgi:hypothetical protein
MTWLKRESDRCLLRWALLIACVMRESDILSADVPALTAFLGYCLAVFLTTRFITWAVPPGKV